MRRPAMLKTSYTSGRPIMCSAWTQGLFPIISSGSYSRSLWLFSLWCSVNTPWLLTKDSTTKIWQMLIFVYCWTISPMGPPNRMWRIWWSKSLVKLRMFLTRLVYRDLLLAIIPFLVFCLSIKLRIFTKPINRMLKVLRSFTRINKKENSPKIQYSDHCSFHKLSNLLALQS